ncbi:MAG TPA: Flp family type IVb pilin [Actinomycetes bacterium]
MLQMIRKHLAAARTHDDGATATEYVLLLAGIAAVIIGAVFLFGNFLSTKFNDVQTSISKAK